MSEQTYFILVALLDEPTARIRDSPAGHRVSNGRVRLAVGTLYGALDRLTENGLIVVDREEVVSGRSRRYFRM